MPDAPRRTARHAATHSVTPAPTGVDDRTKVLDQHELDVSDVLYWPSPVPVHAIDAIEDPLGDYYLYYSASHADSAIRLAYADSPLGSYTDHGRVYEDGDAGPQTETPEVVWNPDAERFHMYYHGFLGTGQSTALAFSTDGLAWEKHGVVVDAPPNTPGDDHTGYFRVHRFGNYWLAHHLLGGGGSGGFGVSYSANGVEWQTDPRRLGRSTDLLGDPETSLRWHETQILQAAGRDWWVGTCSPRDPWASTEGSYVAVAPLADERSLLAPPEPILEPTREWEGDTIYTPAVLSESDATYVFYGTLAGSTHGGGSDPTDGHLGGARLAWDDARTEGPDR